jgi:hypothetical protein
LPREVHAILSARDLAKNRVLQFDYKKRVITITDSKNDEDEFAKARGGTPAGSTGEYD